MGLVSISNCDDDDIDNDNDDHLTFYAVNFKGNGGKLGDMGVGGV